MLYIEILIVYFGIILAGFTITIIFIIITEKIDNVIYKFKNHGSNNLNLLKKIENFKDF